MDLIVTTTVVLIVQIHETATKLLVNVMTGVRMDGNNQNAMKVRFFSSLFKKKTLEET